MARELDSEMLQRLQENYGAMSDGELTALAAQPDDLTDAAREVLHNEMTRRGIEAAAKTHPTGRGSTKNLEDEDAGRADTERPGWVALMTFNDAMATGEACKYLEEAGVEIDVRDRTKASTTGGSMYGGPPVALQIVVPKSDWDLARETLRTKMKLFPVQEVEGDDAPDDGELVTVATFGRREDADEVSRALAGADVWRQVSANPDGAAETEDAFIVEVKEADQERALELVEKSMGIAEE